MSQSLISQVTPENESAPNIITQPSETKRSISTKLEDSTIRSTTPSKTIQNTTTTTTLANSTNTNNNNTPSTIITNTTATPKSTSNNNSKIARSQRSIFSLIFCCTWSSNNIIINPNNNNNNNNNSHHINTNTNINNNTNNGNVINDDKVECKENIINTSNKNIDNDKNKTITNTTSETNNNKNVVTKISSNNLNNNSDNNNNEKIKISQDNKNNIDNSNINSNNDSSNNSSNVTDNIICSVDSSANSGNNNDDNEGNINASDSVEARQIETGQKWLLEPIGTEHTGKKCLVLDLDETLVHSSFKMISHADFIVPVEIENQIHNVYVIKRPGVDQFLKKMGELYEIVVFTASLSKYADPVLDILDIHKVVKHRLFRESCYNHKGNYVKDLSQLGRELRDTIIIDNSPASYIFHPTNAVPISSWFNDPHDTELLDLIPFLEDLTIVDDVMVVLDSSSNPQLQDDLLEE